jgi:hypothetical protein
MATIRCDVLVAEDRPRGVNVGDRRSAGVIWCGIGDVRRGECVAVGDETATLCDEQDGCAGGLAQPTQNRPHGGLGEQAGGQ